MADVAERMRLDQFGQEKPAKQVKKFRELASRMKEAALLIDEYDTVYPHINTAGWEIIEPVALVALGKEASRSLRKLLTKEAVEHYSQVKQRGRTSIEKSIRANPGIVIFHLLTTLGSIFRKVADRLKKETRAGPRRLKVGPTLLFHIAETYFSLGRRPVTSRRGPFRDFVEDVLVGIGVDTNFVDGHIAAAVNAWRKNKRPPRERLMSQLVSICSPEP